MPTTTAYTGQVTSYTDTTAQVRCIEELIHNVSPDAVPLTKLIGLNSIKNPPVFSTTYEWLEDALAPMSAVLDDTGIANTTATQFGLATTADSKYFRVGHIIKIEDELLWVSASDYAGTLTVSRGFGSTTAAAHTTDDLTVDIVGIAMIEGADASTGFKMDVTTGYNYTQVIQDTVQVTGTQAKMKQYGIKGEMPYQITKKFKELAVALEKNLFHGYRASGSSTTARAFGGLLQFITNNVTSCSSAALTEKNIMDTLQMCFVDVGQEYMPDTIVCSGWAKRKIASFYAPYARMDRQERVGGVVVDQIDTDFGRLDVLLDVWCKDSDMWLLSTKLLGIGPMRPFEEQELSKSGDYEKRQIVGEYTFKCSSNDAHGRVYGFSTSS